MPTFHYESSIDPRVAGTLSDLMLRRGDIAARAAQQNGAIWGGAIQNIGQMVGALPAQIQQAKRAQLQDALGTLQLRGATQAADDDQRLRTAYQQSGGDPAQMRTLLASSGGLTLQHDQTLQAMEAQQADRHKAITSQIGLTLHDRLRPDDPTNNLQAMQDALDTAEQQKLITSEQAQQFGALASADPSKIPEVAKSWAGLTAAGRAEIEKTITAKPGEVTTSRWDGAPVGTPLPEDRKTAAELAADAANPNSPTQAQSKAALALLKPPQKGTAEQEDARYEQLTADRTLGKPIAPDDAAWSKAYEQRKKLTVDASASAAADRQAKATENATAQQKRSQDFQVLQTARGDIQKNADTIYSTAHTAAETLRDTVAAAKAGNKFAASQQTLEATMATLKSQGFSRLNATELGVSANAGNLWDRISGYLGKKAEGQPVPADLQKDMLAFADILDKAAYKKYSDAHDAVNKLYGTSIPKTFQAPAAAAPSAEPIKVGGFSVVVK